MTSYLRVIPITAKNSNQRLKPKEIFVIVCWHGWKWEFYQSVNLPKSENLQNFWLMTNKLQITFAMPFPAQKIEISSYEISIVFKKMLYRWKSHTVLLRIVRPRTIKQTSFSLFVLTERAYCLRGRTEGLISSWRKKKGSKSNWNMFYWPFVRGHESYRVRHIFWPGNKGQFFQSVL